MVRTPKGSKSKGYGYGGRRKRGKKSPGQKQAEQTGRFWRSVIEKQVRQENPRWSEGQIRAEVKRKITERKNPPPKPSTDYRYGRY